MVEEIAVNEEDNEFDVGADAGCGCGIWFVAESVEVDGVVDVVDPCDGVCSVVDDACGTSMVDPGNEFEALETATTVEVSRTVDGAICRGARSFVTEDTSSAIA
jgi:hypothetical protein